MNPIVQEANVLQAELENHLHFLHQNPEIGMELPRTSAFVKQTLEEMGYEATYIAGSGVTALVGGKKPGKVIMLRADMDALPITEETDLIYKSTNDNMHACGHDFHTTMLLGAAKLLKAHEDEIEGTIKLLFQPGEEILHGAKTMIAHGILENPSVDAAMMIHVIAGYPITSGIVAIPPVGTFTTASDRFEIEIQGKGSHGAMPENSIDPLIVASHIHLALQEIRSREVASNENIVLTVATIQGGTVHNIIPDTAIMKGTLRTYRPEVRKFVHERIETIAKCIAEGFRATAEVKIIPGCPSVINDKQITEDAKQILTTALGSKSIVEFAKFGILQLPTSEDFSFVTQEVPSVMLILSAGSSKEGYSYPLHHPKVTFDVRALANGAAAYASFGMDWLKMN